MAKTYFKLVEFVERLIELKFSPLNKFLENVERRSRVKKNLQIHGITIALLIFSVINYFGAALHYISGYLYPAFRTMEAMSSKNQEQMNHWLKYWAVFGFLQVLEGVADNSLGIMPMYHIVKALFVCWCYAPIEFNGANYIFQQYMLPAYEMVKGNSLDELGSKALDQLGDTLKIKLDAQPESGAQQLKTDLTQAAATLPIQQVVNELEAAAASSAKSEVSGNSFALSTKGSKILVSPVAASKLPEPSTASSAVSATKRPSPFVK